MSMSRIGFCPQVWHGGAAHVFDTEDKLAKRTYVNSSERGKLRCPLGIVRCENQLTQLPWVICRTLHGNSSSNTIGTFRNQLRAKGSGQ